MLACRARKGQSADAREVAEIHVEPLDATQSPERGRGARALAIALGLVLLVSLGFVASRDRDEARATAPVLPATTLREPLAPAGVVREGDVAPDLEVPALAGEGAIRLVDLRGRVVLVNAWASWCVPCVQEMPSLERAHRELSDEGVTVVAIAVDDPPEPARALAERLGLTMPLGLDQGGRQFAKWSTVKYPETWIVGRDGTVLSRVVGARDWSRAETLQQLRGLRDER